jgi:non-specific protein-tyrosine kinase
MGGVAFLIEYLDDTLKTPEDINRDLGLPVIGMIGKMDGKPNMERVYVAENPRSSVAESYRTLRTNLEFASVDKPIKTLLVTSADPTSGKSTVAANLAVSIAQGNRRVALVDADLRRPALHKILQVPNRVGLSDLFRSQTPPPNALRKWGEPPTLIMTSGSLPPNPTELLGTRKMDQILADLNKVTDMIILDSPPFIVSDPIVLSAKVDGVLLVVKPGSTRIEAVQSMLEQLQRAGAWVVGVVLNPISLKEGYYYGSESYGYGVNSDGDQPKKSKHLQISRVKPSSD